MARRVLNYFSTRTEQIVGREGRGVFRIMTGPAMLE